ncbi:MAG: translation elongation factor 4 [Candidatus Shikimatogenerans bostrichidophilus]|nr:MAG: translation elongation factor 4 [Candidatus Shikimatogenerans bostrichidophilus]
MNLKYIRNFCIIAHIDHGKSTLAYQLLKYTNTIKYNKKLLDNMELEIEKGITIKNHIIQINYKYKNIIYKLNLIDTPGHADFTYEVYKSILACEGAILLIDISKNIQAQTISNLKLAFKKRIKIIPVLNKIDLDINYYNVKKDVKVLLNCKSKDILCISAKEGIGINKLIKTIIKKIPNPVGDINKPLQAFIIDSNYDNYRGIIIYFRIFNGTIKNKDKLKLLYNNKIITVNNLRTLENFDNRKNKITAGNVGSFLYKTKNLDDIIIGDTLVNWDDKKTKTIFKINDIKSNIFISIFPLNSTEYIKLKKSIKKLKLNDYSFTYIKDFSNTFGFGFRCGFLGILHFEIIKERILREYNINIITTIPNVEYKIILKNNNIKFINNPLKYPNINEILYIMEPYMKVIIITYNKYIGDIITFCIKKRGILIDQKYIISSKVKLIFNLPLNEILYDFYNKIKVLTKGFNSINYNFIGYIKSNIIKVDIYINNIIIDGFSFFSHIDNAYIKSKNLCKKLKELIPRKQFEIPIQAYINNRIIVRETIPSYRKDVTSKCYGGDITRKMKLLNKQKLGKRKMRKIGKVDLPQSIFFSLINIE